MNGFKYSTKHKYTKTDNIDKRMPHYIDTVAIMYPNGRFYYNVEFASDKFDGNEVVHFKVPDAQPPAYVWVPRLKGDLLAPADGFRNCCDDKSLLASCRFLSCLVFHTFATALVQLWQSPG
jgi:hypothetical protein